MGKFLVISAVVLSMFAFAVSLMALKANGLEAYSFVVSAFTLLCTVLIGWQIFQSLSVSAIRKEIMQEKIAFEYEKEKMMAVLYFEIATTYYRRDKDNAWWVYPYTNNAIKSVAHAAKSKSEETLAWIDSELALHILPLTGIGPEQITDRKEALSLLTFGDRKILCDYKNIQNLIQ